MQRSSGCAARQDWVYLGFTLTAGPLIIKTQKAAQPSGLLGRFNKVEAACDFSPLYSH